MTNSAWLASAGRSYAIYAGLVVPPLAMRRTVVSTFAMNDSIVEVFMKRQWRVRRQLQSTADVGGVGTGPTNISWNGPYRASRFPLCCSRFALHREWRRGMRTAVYLRVSTNRQTQAQTMEQQWERLQAHGASLTRPGLDRLRDRVKSATLDRVLLTSPDRLARNYVHQMVLIEEWERSGCRVEFLDRPMSQDPHDQLLLQIRGAVAEYERVLIAERMRRGRQMKLQAGVLLPWTIPPYGYRSAPDRPRDPSGVQIEPAEGAIVQELFTLYLADKGTLLSLAKYLLHLDLPSPRGNRRWSTASLRGVLTNPAYTGKLYIGRSRSRPARIRRSATHPLGNPTHGQDATPVEEWILVGTVPALVSQADFDRVQAVSFQQRCVTGKGSRGERSGSVQLTEEQANAHGDIAIHLGLSHMNLLSLQRASEQNRIGGDPSHQTGSSTLLANNPFAGFCFTRHANSFWSMPPVPGRRFPPMSGGSSTASTPADSVAGPRRAVATRSDNRTGWSRTTPPCG